MIDSHAVIAHLEQLEGLSAEAVSRWIRDQAVQLSLVPERDADGNHWLTMPGTNSRTVVLGSCLPSATDGNSLDSSLAIVTALETLKALKHRFEGPPPCSVRVVVWSSASAGMQIQAASLSGADPATQDAVAYLEVHLEPGNQLQQAGTPLAVATAAEEGALLTLHPHLTTLCDEAIRELTGISATLPVGRAPHATAIAQLGIPTAILYVQQPLSTTDATAASDTRLHLLQSAETFGRWVEATVHAVAGDQADLWAQEHRVPHTS